MNVMPALIFPLRHVPEDEAAEVRELFAQNGLETYETEPSPFGVHAGAIWLRDESDRERASLLLAEYQRERERACADKALAGSPGALASFVQFAQARPLAVLALSLALLSVLIVSAWPFFGFKAL